MNILIFGATGATGKELVKQALEQGHTVTAFMRTPAKLKITHHNLKLVKGDLADLSSVEDAVKGQDAVLSALGASSPFRYDQSVVDGVRNIIKTMGQSAVKRFIYLSFAGVRESRKQGGFLIRYIAPMLLKTEISGHEAREKMLRHSSLAWTIVRAVTLTNGVKIGAYRSGEGISSNSFTATISRADVAHFMLKQMNDNRFERKAATIMY